MKYIIIFVILVVASMIDIRKRIVQNFILFSLFISVFVNFDIVNIVGSVVVLPFFISAFINKNKMGGGDIKLVFFLGMSLGFYNTVITVILGLTSVLIYKIVKTVFWGTCEKSVPLVPFLTIGYILLGGKYEIIKLF